MADDNNEFTDVSPADTVDSDLAATWDRLHPDQPSVQGQAPSAPAYDGPQSWSAPMRQRWSAVPEDVRQYIEQREREAQSAISRMGQERAQYEPFRKNDSGSSPSRGYDPGTGCPTP